MVVAYGACVFGVIIRLWKDLCGIVNYDDDLYKTTCKKPLSAVSASVTGGSSAHVWLALSHWKHLLNELCKIDCDHF